MAVRRNLLIAGVALALIAGLLGLRRAIAVRPEARLRATPDGRVGSWWFPRGGPYILGFDSPAPAALLIDGVVVASGAGQVTTRRVYPEDGRAHAVELRAPPAARLLWHPPGRRGEPEYVPASSLSPDPPEQARFRGPGASRRDAAYVTLALAILAAAALLIARPRPDRRLAAVAVAVYALALVVRLAVVAHGEQTWDEDEYWSAGRNYLTNILDGDFSYHSWRFNHAHPPLTKYLAGVGALWADGYGPARALFALLGAGTAALALAIGRRLFGLRAGIFAALAVALAPRLVAHDAVIGHEGPSVFLWTLCVWLALRAHDDPDRLARRLAAVAVAVALAMGVRLGNVFVAPLVAVILLVRAGRARLLRTAVIGLAVGPAVAAVAFFALWPSLWHGPLRHLDLAYHIVKHARHLPEYYLGRLGEVGAWHYFPLYTLVTVPAAVLALALAGGAWRAVARREGAMLVVLAWLLAPFGMMWLPVRQDGVRYVVQVMVPVAVLAGAGLDQLAAAVHRPRAHAWAGALLGVYLAVTCARIHPYYLDYYGEHVGGPAAVGRRHWFKTAWWGEGIGEAVAYIDRHAQRGDSVARLAMPNHVNWLSGSLWRDVRPTAAEWLLVNEQGLMALRLRDPRFAVPPGFRLVHEVRAQGLPLAQVYRRVR